MSIRSIVTAVIILLIIIASAWVGNKINEIALNTFKSKRDYNRKDNSWKKED